MPYIETHTGAVSTTGNGSLSINAFYRKSLSDNEVPLFKAEGDKHSGVRQIGMDIIQSGAVKTERVWSKKRYEVPETCYVKVTLTKTIIRAGFSRELHFILLRPREGAVLHRIAIDLPCDARSTMSVAYYEGRFDILQPEEIQKLNLHLKTNGGSELENYDPEGYEDYVHITELEKGSAPPVGVPKPVVVKSTSSGEEKTLLRAPRRRNVRNIS